MIIDTSEIQPAADLEPRPAAVFDLDRTLLPGSSLVHVGRVALQMGLIAPRMLAKGLWDDARFRIQGSSNGQVRSLHTQLLGMAAGVETGVVDELVTLAAPRIVGDMRPDMRGRLEHHLDLGDLVVILSASPDEVVRAVAESVGADHGLGTVAQVLNGSYSGHLDGEPCYGPGKVTRLERAELPIDPGASFAYADSISDVHVLRWVKHPIAVSPDNELRRLAEFEGWPVVEAERVTRLRVRRAA